MTPRTARCHNCHTPAPLTDHLCKTCQSLQEARQSAYNDAGVINHLCASYSDESLVSDMLNRLVWRSGMKAPLILQAIRDRVEWLPSAVTYPAVAQIALAEAQALIPGIWVA